MAGALRDGEPLEAVRDAFARLREALEAHVDQEDRLYYPALRALRPEHRAAVGRLIEGHVEIRARLGAIEQSLAEASAAGAALAEFAARFAAHEAAEEQLLHALDAELHAASTAR